ARSEPRVHVPDWPSNAGELLRNQQLRRHAVGRFDFAGLVRIASMRATTSMTTTSRVHRLLLTVFGTALLLIGGAAPSRAQTVVVMVNGEPITDFDIEQRSKLDLLTTQKSPGRQEVINELIDEKVKIKEGKKYGVEPTSSDVDQSFSGMAQRMRITPDQLAKSLEVKGVRPETLKNR